MNDETLKEQIKQALNKDFNNLLVKEFTTDWKVQRLKIGLDIEVMDFDNLIQLILQDRERVRIDERNTVALDNYRGHTFSKSTDWEGKYNKFITNNENRIAQLKSNLEKGKG